MSGWVSIRALNDSNRPIISGSLTSPSLVTSMVTGRVVSLMVRSPVMVYCSGPACPALVL